MNTMQIRILLDKLHQRDLEESDMNELEKLLETLIEEDNNASA